MSDLDARASSLLDAYDRASLLAPITEADPAFDLGAAFAVADVVLQRRLARGERRLGWKIGFTNRTIWDRYGVHAPIWGPVWDTTVRDVDATGGGEVSLAALAQPRLEPEIQFGFARAPRAGMTERELAACIEWVAHGFEIVQTHFADWRFRAADTVADFALHGRLFVGRRAPISAFTDPAGELARVRVVLHEDGRPIDEGTSDVVLGGPLTALRLWIDAMSDQPCGWAVDAGDVVSTGTLTDAAPLRAGRRFHTTTSDPRLPGVALSTTL